MSSSPPDAVGTRPRPRGRRAADLAVAVAVLAGGVGAIAVDAASAPDADVRTARVGDVRPLPPPRVPAAGSLVAADTPIASAATTTPASTVATAQRPGGPPIPAVQVSSAPEGPAETTRAAVWDRLADCESGHWRRDRTPVEGSARWDYGLDPSHDAIFEGGLQFHPVTWDEFRSEHHPDHAGRATRAQQIVVAERVLAVQGWQAWPVCSRKLGYR